MVGERSPCGEAEVRTMVERGEGRMLAGVTKMRVRNPHAESPRVPVAMLISPGLVGP